MLYRDLSDHFDRIQFFSSEAAAAMHARGRRARLRDLLLRPPARFLRMLTPLAYALKVLSAEFRRERLMRAEEKAAQLPAIMTLPLALFILPVLFMVVIGPAIINAIGSFKGSKLPGGG